MLNTAADLDHVLNHLIYAQTELLSPLTPSIHKTYSQTNEPSSPL
jgi:hypothetical protein